MRRYIVTDDLSAPAPAGWHLYHAGTSRRRRAAISDDLAILVPTDWILAGRDAQLPVSPDEISAYRSRFPAGFEIDESTLEDDVRLVRGDYDWYAEVCPLGMDEATASHTWVDAVDGAIGTEHSRVYIRYDGGSWYAWAGLGSRMTPARGGAGKRGCRHTSREAAIEAGVALVRDLRTSALVSLRQRLAGWHEDAILRRITPCRSMRMMAGWEPLLPDIAIHEAPRDGDPACKYWTASDGTRIRYDSSWDAPIVERVPAEAIVL